MAMAKKKWAIDKFPAMLIFWAMSGIDLEFGI